MTKAILAVKVNPSADQQRDFEDFLSFNPNGEEIRRFIGTPSYRYFYHPTSREATYVTITGLSVICIKVPEVTEAEAKAIYDRLMVPRVDNSAWMSLPLFQGVVSSVTGKVNPAIWHTRV